MLRIVSTVKENYPDCLFGIMIVGGLGAAEKTVMEKIKKEELEKIRLLHKAYERKQIVVTEPLCHYISYYKKFKKTYPVLLQFESILTKNKGIPDVGAPIEAMFLAEIKNLLLTAGHDLEKLSGQLAVNIAEGGETFCGIADKMVQLTQKDIFLADDQGILSSILNGPDCRSKITAATKTALYFVYGVDGVEKKQIKEHLEMIGEYLAAAVPDVKIQSLEIY